jgi:hypothetical protein
MTKTAVCLSSINKIKYRNKIHEEMKLIDRVGHVFGFFKRFRFNETVINIIRLIFSDRINKINRKREQNNFNNSCKYIKDNGISDIQEKNSPISVRTFFFRTCHIEWRTVFIDLYFVIDK